MNKRLSLALAIMLSIAILCVATSQPVKAVTMTGLTGIVITPDGSIAQTAQPMQISGSEYYLPGNTLVDFTTQPIYRNGDTYIITGNIINYSLIIERSNIVIDGSGFTIQPLQPNSIIYDIGISLPNVNNITINNLEIAEFSNGILLSSSTNCKLTNDTIETLASPGYGYGNEKGIILSGSSNNVITNNTLQDGGISILASNNHPSYNNTLSQNKLYNCNFAIDDWLSATSLSDFINSIDASNLVDGKPVFYLVNQTSLIINPETFPKIGFLALINCNNITVENLALTNTTANVEFAYLRNSIIQSNIFEFFIQNGVYIIDCSSNQIKNNTVTVPYNPEAYQNYALVISNSSNNFVFGNTIVGGYFGLMLCNSLSNIVFENKVVHSLANSTPTIPEFSWLVIVPLLLSVFAVALIVRHRKATYG